MLVNQWVRLLNWMDIDGIYLLAVEEKPHDLVVRVWERSSDSNKGRYRESNRVNGWPTESVRAEDTEWWGIEETWSYDQVRTCKSYYPQLFFGRWVPLDDFGAEKWLEEAVENLEEAREKDDWLDWAETHDRDILIRLRE